MAWWLLTGGSVTFQRNSLPDSAGDPELLQHIRGRASDERPVPRDVLRVRCNFSNKAALCDKGIFYVNLIKVYSYIISISKSN